MGLYRLLLAYCVVIEHLAEGNASVSHAGMFAVFGFYVLSGFLITRVLNEVYKFRFAPFWSNRFLRLYPSYFVVLAIGLVIVFGSQDAGKFFPAVWADRPAPIDWFATLTIFPMGFAPMSWSFRPVPSAWSVGVELINYVVLYAVVARRREAAIIVATGAAAFHIFALWHGDTLGDRYFAFYAALLPFSLGALVYFCTCSVAKDLSSRGALLLCAPAIANCVLAGVLGGITAVHFELLFYLNLFFQCMAVTGFALMRGARWHPIDSLLGDLSYPVFLCHWLVGYVLATTLFSNQIRGFGLAFATLVAATASAYVIRGVQSFVEPWRIGIRAQVRHRTLNLSKAPNRSCDRKSTSNAPSSSSAHPPLT